MELCAFVCVCVFVKGQRRQSVQVIDAGCISLLKSLGDHLQLPEKQELRFFRLQAY